MKDRFCARISTISINYLKKDCDRNREWGEQKKRETETKREKERESVSEE